MAINLQATSSATDLSSPRCLDDKMLRRLADAIAALERRDANFACLQAQIIAGVTYCRYGNPCSIPGWLFMIFISFVGCHGFLVNSYGFL